jgi:hypothetical protein
MHIQNSDLLNWYSINNSLWWNSAILP